MEKQTEILVVCEATSSRLLYITRFISEALGISLQIRPQSNLRQPVIESNTCCIYYGSTAIDGAFNIWAHGLLSETGIRPFEPDVVKTGELSLLIPAPQGFDLPFDLFSAAFYLLSRYEEYLPFVPDRYGRFEAGQSIAFRHNFLHEPVIDQWIQLFGKALAAKFPGLSIHKRRFRFVPTFDVDIPWAFRHSGWLRIAGSLARHAMAFHFREVRLRLAVLTGSIPDPYDIYDYVRNLEETHHFRAHFFFLSGNSGKYDINYPLNTRAFRSLLRQMDAERAVGIHPSVKSNKSISRLRAEYEKFARILGKAPKISRQHFLNLKFPETYDRLISLGIETDYSMGYASQPGFRAGTTLPFRFYHLKNETETPLVIHPFAVMDVTLRQYLGLNSGEAIDLLCKLIRKVRRVNGVFTSLWHNESLSEYGPWTGWREVFIQLVKAATGYK
ncbi:MAG: polysaccharide deacetylase family protein [Bacteroidales bacterium]|nr:polysaccharide deacetylase family protein [Bacteroidales bacterium]